MAVTKIKKSDLKSHIRDIPDFPKEGIIFKDITTLLQNGPVFKKSVDLLAKKFKKENIELIVGVEARGFIFGAALSYKINLGFIPIRKPGKLPAEESYFLFLATCSTMYLMSALPSWPLGFFAPPASSHSLVRLSFHFLLMAWPSAKARLLPHECQPATGSYQLSP